MHTHTLSPHFKLIPIAHTLLVSLSHMHSVLLHSPSLSHTHGLFATTSKMPMCCTEHQDAFVWVVYLVGEKMNKGSPYLQMWRGLWVSFFKIAIVSFLSVRYRSDGLYCRMAGTRSSPTMLFIRVGIKNKVGDDGGPAILQCRSSDLYLTDRKENMAIYPHSSPHLQIRPSLVHPFLPQDLDVPCNARASC